MQKPGNVRVAGDRDAAEKEGPSKKRKRFTVREPLIKSRAVAAVCNPSAGRGVRSAVWWRPNQRRTTTPCAWIASSLRVAVKCVVCVVALLGFVVLATTFVARLASVRILPATQSAEDLIRGSLLSII